MVFSARELAPLLRRRDARPTEQYDLILDRIMSRIRVVAAQGGTHCFYEVPAFVPGFPLLDVRTCAAYLILKLRRLEFQVQYFPSGHLWIGWFHVQAQRPSPAVPALPAPGIPNPRPPTLETETPPANSEAVRNLRRIYDEASIDVLTRLAPRPHPS